jgi:hypothetical protein
LSEFFFLHLLDREGAPVAYGADDAGRDQVLEEPGEVADWLPVELEVRGGDPTDYLANNIGMRLCSARLRDVVEQQRGDGDQLQWLEVQVVDESGVKHRYFVLHVPTHPDVLDPRRTIWAGESFVVKPVLSRDKLQGLRVFSFAGATTRLVVADVVRRAILDAGCTGVDFAKAPVS